MENCVFCNIVHKVISKELLYEDGDILAFHDLLPQAPVHLLIVSKEHIPSVTVLEERHQALLGKMVLVAKKLAEESKIDQSGYKLIYNVGKDGGQVIQHLHLHVLGGKKLSA
jgi:histidine triad (HIT) family protein